VKMSITAACTIALIGLWIVGCQNTKKDSMGAADPSVTELSSTHSSSPAPQPYVAPAAAPAPQPVVYDSTPPANGAVAPVAGASASGPYTVKKGDTLYSIAKTRYGSGKEYPKIVAANPGLSAEHLKVGQTIQVP